MKDLLSELLRIDEIGKGKTIIKAEDKEPKTIRELEAADSLNLKIVDRSLEHHVKLAKYIIQEALLRFPKRRIYVAISGGKASLITADLVRKATHPKIPVTLCYSNTGLESPSCVKFTRRIPEILEGEFTYKEHRPEISFFNILRSGAHIFPSKSDRWCCSCIKTNPPRRWLESLGTKPLLFLGIQQTENSYRYTYWPYDKTNKKTPGAAVFNPIFYFNDREVWRYIQTRGLEYASLYRQAVTWKDKYRHWHTLQYTRNGCWLCPLPHTHGNPHFILLKGCYPKLFEALKKTVERYSQPARNLSSNRGDVRISTTATYNGDPVAAGEGPPGQRRLF